MATETLTPNTEAAPQEWLVSGTATHWEAVLTNDGDTSYIYAGSAVLTDYVSMTNPVGIGASDTINSVQVCFLGRYVAGAAPQISPCVGDGVGTTVGTLQTQTTSYTLYSQTWATKPSGGAWTLATLNNMICGVQRNVASSQARVTQIYAVVDYTVYVPPGGGAGAARNFGLVV